MRHRMGSDGRRKDDDGHLMTRRKKLRRESVRIEGESEGRPMDVPAVGTGKNRLGW